MSASDEGLTRREPLDLEAVSRLVSDIERDLQAVRLGASDIDHLRAEVRALSLALERDPVQGPDVHRRLQDVHSRVDALKETAREDAFVAADYAARIGRMLGM